MLTGSPVIVHDIPESLVAEARANRGRPFPWGGNYTAVASVSVHASDGERGLHLVGAPLVVSVDGVAAYDFSTGAGHRFTVDPNFMLYDPVPFRVTAVVRYNGDADAKDGAGFNLKYESIQGLRGAGGWTNIPRDSEWHTLTWDIDDPQFVGRWGYDFILDSDSTMFSHYDLQSLSITKR